MTEFIFFNVVDILVIILLLYQVYKWHSSVTKGGRIMLKISVFFFVIAGVVLVTNNINSFPKVMESFGTIK